MYFNTDAPRVLVGYLTVTFTVEPGATWVTRTLNRPKGSVMPGGGKMPVAESGSARTSPLSEMIVISLPLPPGSSMVAAERTCSRIFSGEANALAPLLSLTVPSYTPGETASGTEMRSHTGVGWPLCTDESSTGFVVTYGASAGTTSRLSWSKSSMLVKATPMCLSAPASTEISRCGRSHATG